MKKANKRKAQGVGTGITHGFATMCYQKRPVMNYKLRDMQRNSNV